MRERERESLGEKITVRVCKREIEREGLSERERLE